MSETINITMAPKDTTFQMRINYDIKRKLEETFAECGLTLTEAINIFLQQSLNAGGLPFIVNSSNSLLMREQAIAILMNEIEIGEKSIENKGWISEEVLFEKYGVD